MKTYGEFGKIIEQIRDASDRIEVKGRVNRAYADFIFDKCNELIQALNEAAERARDRESEVERDGEPDQDMAG